MRLLVVIFIFISFSFGKCYISCIANISNENAVAQKDINKSFIQLTNSLRSLHNTYENYLSSYEEQNKLLKKLQDLRAYNLKKLDEINFLLESTNALLNIKIMQAGESNVKN